MTRKTRHLLSTIIGILIHLFLSRKKEIESPVTHSKIMTLTPENVCSIKEGTWLVFTEKYNPEFSAIKRYPDIKYAVIVVDSIGKAEIAASVGINDPTKHSIIRDGVCVDTSTRVDPSFTKTLDCFVYYWALRLRKMIESSVGIDHLVESLIFSVIKLSFEIIRYCLTSFGSLLFHSDI